MANPQTRKRDGDELGNDSISAPKRAHLEADHDKPGPHTEYLRKQKAACPKAVVEALELELAETKETDGSASSNLATESIYIVLRSQGAGASRYANESDTSTVGIYRSVVSANCNALMAFDGTVDYSEEDGRSCDNDDDIDAEFLRITAPPFYPEDGTAGWWIEADTCLHLSAGDTVDGDTEVWVEKRVLED